MSRWAAWLASLLIVIAMLLPVFQALPALADPPDSSAAGTLKSIAPQIDPNADIGHKAPPKKALQATIQHNENGAAPARSPLNAAASSGSGFLGKLRSGRQAAGEMRGRVNNNGLNAQVTAGVGIIGVRFLLAGGKPPVINRVFPGTPAARVGLLPFDAIVAVDGVPTFGLSKEEVYDLIIGSPGTTVNVSIMRGSDFHVVTCTRMDINELTDPVVRRDYMMSM